MDRGIVRILPFILASLTALSSPSIARAQGTTPGTEGKEVILVGTLVGAKCVETGKLRPCPLEWAYPMVLFSETGTYRLAFGPVGTSLWELDRAFGKRVAIVGTLTGDTITIRNLALLEPLEEGKITRA